MIGAALSVMIVLLVGSGKPVPSGQRTAAAVEESAHGTVPTAGGSTADTALAAVGPRLAGAIEQAGLSVVRVDAVYSGRTHAGFGIEIGSSGSILTAESLLDGADSVSVVDASGAAMIASTVGLDPVTDIGVLRVEPTSWRPILVARSPGGNHEVVAAVTGRPGHGPSGPQVYLGEVTGTMVNEDVPGQPPVLHAIATDVSLPSGSLGTPLVDRSGHLVGMVAWTAPAGGRTLAVPASTAVSAMRSLLATGSVPHGWAGIENVVASPLGLVVGNLTPGGPAARAGLLPGDVLVSARGERLASLDDLWAAVRLRSPGTHLVFHIERAGSALTVTIVLGSMGGS